MTILSQSAQAVLDAAISAAESPDAEAIAAAALRAAVEQVVPELGCPVYGLTTRENERQQVRGEFLAIAAELDPTTPGVTND